MTHVSRDLHSFRHCGNPDHPVHFPWDLRQSWAVVIYWGSSGGSLDKRLSQRVLQRPPLMSKQLTRLFQLELLAAP